MCLCPSTQRFETSSNRPAATALLRCDAGPLEDLKIADGAADWEVAGAYGTGYLAVRQLAERFGEADVLAFMKALTHDRMSIDDASREVFGEPWSVLNEQCVAAIRAAAA